MNERSQLELLFSPGAGVAPPKLAGRDDILRLMDKQLRLARAGKGRSVVLIGPHGNGKTVLMGEFARRCRAADVDVAWMTPKEIGDRNALAQRLLQDDAERKAGANEDASVGALLPPGVAVRLDKLRSSMPRLKSVGLLGLLSLEFENLSGSERAQIARQMEALLTAASRACPRVAIVDEAHTLDLDVGGTLLNAAQKVSGLNQAPFLLALAGTPQLHRRMAAMESSFWERCEEVGVGRLSDEAAREALETPLAEHGVSFAPEALDAVAEESQRYPYFVQLWGEALCEALPEDASEIDLSTVEAAREAADLKRTNFYMRRRKEIWRRGLLQAAESVADFYARVPVNATAQDGQVVSHLEKSLGASPAEAFKTFESLRDMGYVWEPPGEEIAEPGIPSLMEYVLRRSESRSAENAPAP